MRVKHHAALSVGAAALTFLGTRSFPAAATAGLAGTLLDLDHLPALLRHGIVRSRTDESFPRTLWHLTTMDNRELGRRYRIDLPETYNPGHFLHQIEIVLLIPIAFFLAGCPYPALGLGIGILSHLAADILTNKPSFQTISLLARLLAGGNKPESMKTGESESRNI